MLYLGDWEIVEENQFLYLFALLAGTYALGLCSVQQEIVIIRLNTNHFDRISVHNLKKNVNNLK